MPTYTRASATIPDAPIEGLSTGEEAFGASLGETWATGPTGAADMFQRLQKAEHLSIGERIIDPLVGKQSRTLSPRLSPDQAQQRVADAGLEGQVPLDQYPQGIRSETLQILIDANTAKVRRGTILQQADGWAPQVGGMLVGSLVDPINVASAFVPVVGEARYAQLLSRSSGVIGRAVTRVGVGALEGGAGAAIVEPLIYTGQQQWRNDYDAYDSLLNVAGGAGFGALLHAGAGLAKDAFGRPIEPKMPEPLTNTPPAREVFADPGVLMAQEFQAKARAAGVSEQVAKDLTPSASIDDVTGYFDGQQMGVKSRTVQRAIDHSAKTGEPAFYVSADVSNLGGLNAHVGNVAEAANVHYRALADILARELRGTGADVVPMRTGGDEVGLVVVNADPSAMQDALHRVDDATAQYVRDNGLAGIPNPKRPGEFGVGLHTGVAMVDPKASVSDVINRADMGVDASKRGLNVRREAPQPHGAGPNTGAGTGRVPAPADGGVRPEGQGLAAAAEAVRPFIAELEPQTQAQALRHALAQDAQGQPVDVTPAMLTDPNLAHDPLAFREATQRAEANAQRTAGADLQASQSAAQALEAPRPSEPLVQARELLADAEARYKELGGSELEFDAGDEKMVQQAVKAATLCMMRTGA